MDISKFSLDRNKQKLSEQELKVLDKMSPEAIKELIAFHDKQYNYYKAVEQGLKLALNSIYGAFGNKHFVCSTTDISFAITAMGRDLIQYMDKINETYWYDHWHHDSELHQKLGITIQPSPIDSSWIHRESKTAYDGEVTDNDVIEGVYQRKVPTSLYSDTDSLFLGFIPGMKSCNWPEQKEQWFIETVVKQRIEPLFKKKLDSYAKRYGVKNLEDFEMENINESVLFLVKKSYIKHTIWEDGVQYQRLKNLVPKNVSLIKRGTPPFAREKVFEIINYIFDHHKAIKLNQILKFVIDQRKQFEMVDNKDQITMSTTLNMYLSHKVMIDGLLVDGPGVVNDKDKLQFGKSTYVTVKASGLYNYLLNQRPDLKVKYEQLVAGMKVKIYPCKSELNDKFAYPLGAFPHEIAPEIDYDTLFEKTVSAQVNIFMHALGLPELNKRLKVVMPIF